MRSCMWTRTRRRRKVTLKFFHIASLAGTAIFVLLDTAKVFEEDRCVSSLHSSFSVFFPFFILRSFPFFFISFLFSSESHRLWWETGVSCSFSIRCLIYETAAIVPSIKLLQTSWHLVFSKRISIKLNLPCRDIWNLEVDRTRLACLKALANEDTLLRTHCCPWCFLGYANWETFVADTKCFWTKSETFLFPGHKICVRNKCCARGQTGKHLCRQQCVRNNVS